MSDGPDLPPETWRALEAIIMVASDPVPPQMLAQLLEVGVERVEAACAELAAAYERQGRGFVLARVAGGYRYQSHPDAAPYVERYVLEGQAARLSSAALETLAIVAYKQPLSRAQVSSIRGVNVDGVMRTLQHRGLVAEVARDPGPGQAVLYGTTPLFLERLGIDSLDDLPAIASFVPGADVVEALEHSLRLDATEPAGEDTSDDGEDRAGDEVAGDGDAGARPGRPDDDGRRQAASGGDQAGDAGGEDVEAATREGHEAPGGGTAPPEGAGGAAAADRLPGAGGPAGPGGSSGTAGPVPVDGHEDGHGGSGP